MQNDFITGSLAVNDAEEIVSAIADLANKEVWNQVIYTQDWHPKDHISFFSKVDLRPVDSTWRSEHPGKLSMFEEVVFKRYPPYAQVLWPDHCVKGTEGKDQYCLTLANEINIIGFLFILIVIMLLST